MMLSDVFESASDGSVKESKEDNNQENDRYKAEGYHAISPPYTGNFIPPRPDLSFAGLDDSILNLSSAPIIEDWESDSDEDCEIRPSIEQNKPSHAKINFVKSDKNTRKSVIEQHTYKQAENLRKSQKYRVNKRDWNGIMTQKLENGFEFKKKACFVCGSLYHLIKDCNFYENKMVGRSVLNNEGMVTGQREVRPVWNNAKKVNHQNFSNNLTHPHPRGNFVPTAVITNSSKVPVNAAKQSSPIAATSTSTTRYVNTAANRPTVNGTKPSLNIFHKSHLPVRRTFNQRTSPKHNDLKEKINTAGTKAVVSAVQGNRENTVKKESSTKPPVKPSLVLVTKPHNKTPYELLIGRSPNLDFMKPFGYPVTILNTFDHLGKFEGNADEGFLVGYSVNSIEINVNAGKARQEKASDHEFILLPFMHSNSPLPSSTQSSDDKDTDEVPRKGDKGVSKGSEIDDQERTDSSTQDVNTAELSINTASTNINIGSLNINIVGPNDPSMLPLEETEPKKVIQALADPSWIEAMQEERLNKKDERGIVVRNKARLVAQGYTQEEGIDYDEVFAPVARIEAIRLFSTYASFIGFIVYQMDVKSAFLYGIIEDDVYVCQPPGFEDPYFPNKVYRVEKSLYGLHQAPRAWYETLSTYLLENRFRRGTIDKNLFIKKDKDDILLVQVYVDDIIFESTKKSLCDEFEQMMHKSFQMSSTGELTFFLGLQVKQKDDGIFINQDNYTTSTPIEPNKALIKDAESEDVDVHLYRSMIGSLMYLTASMPDIMFDVCACARFQVTPKTSHLHAVKRIFRYLKGQPKLGLWYSRDSPFGLEAFSDSNYAGASLDRKSTIGGCQFLGKRLILWQCKKQTIVADSTTEAHYVVAANCYGLSEEFGVTYDEIQVSVVALTYYAVNNGKKQIIATVDGKEFTITEASVRRHLQLEDADGEQTPLFPTMLAIQAEEGEGSRHPSKSQPPPSSAQHIHEEQILTIVSFSHQNTQTSRQSLNEDIELPHTSVPIPNVPDEAVYEEQGFSFGDRLKADKEISDDEEDLEDSSKEEKMIEDIDQDTRITLVTPTKVSSQEDRPEDQLGVLSEAKVLADTAKKKVNTYTRRRRAVSTGSEGVSTASRIFSTAEGSVSTAGESMPVSTTDVVQEGVKDKDEANPLVTDVDWDDVQAQIQADEELAKKSKFNAEQEELLASETTEDEANPLVTDVDWDAVQAQIQADEELAKKMLEEERESLSITERAKLLVELIDKKKKLQAAQRYEAM
nr:retrovirus-related Pol polyprotein from transposon TNT 1-94 [Tanacetum cinerariifolium]